MFKMLLSQILAFLLIALFAQSVCADVLDDLETHVRRIDSAKLPAAMKALVANERINIYVMMDDGTTQIAGAITKDAKIFSFDKESLDKPTLKVFTSEYTITRITSSEDKLKTAREAIQNQEIRYEAVTVGNKVKYGAVGSVMKVYKWVHNIFN